MTQQQTRIAAFVKLGNLLTSYTQTKKGIEQEQAFASWFSVLDEKVALSQHKNGWFSEENVLFSLQGWGQLLTNTQLNNWLAPYTEIAKAKTVAIIMAGNIPLVGFHDFLSTLISGHSVIVKQSSNDNVLLPVLADFLSSELPELASKITFTTERLVDFDAVIATGSNNTARYFEHYFGTKPHIIRKNRNSVAVLTGKETEEDLTALAYDIFTYYGLGCRSVSKLFVPVNYDFDLLFKAVYPYSDIINENKYQNNYDYNKAVYLMSEFKLLENGFLMLKEDSSYSSPIASLFYEKYDDLEVLKQRLNDEAEHIQCVVSKNVIPTEISFGETQKPGLTDYADNINTLEFLHSI